ncbi:DUF998 domain-containing protein [Actinoplanes sp. CA-054009]
MTARATRHLPRLALAGVAACLALFAWLHLTSDLDWQTRTISQYALLTNGWAFDVATLLLATASIAVLAALIRTRLIRPISAPTIGLALWTAGLIGVVVFEKHNWAAGGPSVSGDIHRAASLLAFLSLPAAAIAIGRRNRLIAAFGVLSLLCFTPILWALISEPWTGVRWWRAIPLGTVERLLCGAEVVTLALMAWWPARSRHPEQTLG